MCVLRLYLYQAPFKEKGSSEELRGTQTKLSDVLNILSKSKTLILILSREDFRREKYDGSNLVAL